MKNLQNAAILICLFSLSVFLFSCSSHCNCTLSEDDITYFETEVAESQEAWNSGDRETYGQRYAEEAVFMVANGESLVGQTAIQEWLNAFPDIKVDFEITESMGTCQLAVVTGTYALSMADGTSVDNGKWLEIWQKSEDGQWELTRDMFNSNLPLPETSTEEETPSE